LSNELSRINEYLADPAIGNPLWRRALMKRKPAKTVTAAAGKPLPKAPKAPKLPAKKPPKS
jgi:hypothetical protein